MLRCNIKNMQRRYSTLDKLFTELNRGLAPALETNAVADRPTPAQSLPEATMSDSEREHAMRLMRVNHAGEVAAQALYHGQAVTAKLPEVRAEMEHAAEEENDHLAWCEERIRELGGEVSALQPFWYAGSFALGALAGAIGDKWSLGFVAETEKQVVKHLEEHETQLPAEDQKTRAILKQMKQDEAEHGEKAMQAGGAELPEVVQLMMSLSSKVMTKTAYWW
jgi:ubiquinone biosynthesis monooxygenase Coq7